MDTALDTVIIDPPAAVIAERQRLGLDRFDEVWDGEYHVVPSPHTNHHRIGRGLLLALDRTAREAGLELLYEMNLLVSEATGSADFRIPDLVIFHPDQAVATGVVGAVAAAIEIRSPGDESFAKLPFYERLGVGEVLIIDRDTKVVRRWELVGGVLVESPGEPVGSHQLTCLPVALHTDGGALVVTTDDATSRI